VLLAAGIAYPGEVITGPESDHFALRGNKVEQVLNDPETPGVARAFLRELADGFKDVSTRKAIWEYDEEINGLRSYIDDPNSPHRIWAIGRLLKYADMKDVQRLLTVEDIAAALPQIDLPEKKRELFEKALPVWQHAG